MVVTQAQQPIHTIGPTLTSCGQSESHRPIADRLSRLARRLTGWARMEQRAYARSVEPVLRQLRPSIVVCNNDLELAVYLQRKLPDVQVVHWFHNLELISDGPRRSSFVTEPYVRWQ